MASLKALSAVTATSVAITTGSITTSAAASVPVLDLIGNAISLANGASVGFSNFEGEITVCSWGNAGQQKWLVGGGGVNGIGNIGSAVGAMAYDSSINGYRFTNNTGSTATYVFMAFRLRPSA